MTIDTSGLTPAEIDTAFRKVGNGTPEREVLAYMAACRSAHLRESLDLMTADTVDLHRGAAI